MKELVIACGICCLILEKKETITKITKEHVTQNLGRAL